MQLNIKKTKYSPVKKCAEDLQRNFSKEVIHMDKKLVKRCSTPLIMREMQIETTMRCHLTPERMTILKNSISTKW